MQHTVLLSMTPNALVSTRQCERCSSQMMPELTAHESPCLREIHVWPKQARCGAWRCDGCRLSNWLLEGRPGMVQPWKTWVCMACQVEVQTGEQSQNLAMPEDLDLQSKVEPCIVTGLMPAISHKAKKKTLLSCQGRRCCLTPKLASCQ